MLITALTDLDTLGLENITRPYYRGLKTLKPGTTAKERLRALGTLAVLSETLIDECSFVSPTAFAVARQQSLHQSACYN